MVTLIEMSQGHLPVLASELIALLDPRSGETAVDCTLGGGGHARAVGALLGAEGTLVAIDRDPAAEDAFAALAAELSCAARFIRADFADALAALRGEGLRADIVYLDLGLSSLQLDDPGRGFAYTVDAPLDMRIDPQARVTAAELVNTLPEQRLAAIIREYGEERHARAIAREIVRRRPLARTAELVAAIRAAVPASYRFGRGHPAKRTFQALRIAVNGELDSLDRALPLAWELLRVGGRFAAISFHSLEDRRVKRFLVERVRGCVCPPDFPVCRCGRTPEAELLARRALAPSAEEIARNPRSRAAHLRAARKIAGGD